MSVYELLRPSIPSWGREWGRFAEVCLVGWCNRRQDGLLDLTRAGPFVPPIMLPESDMGRMIWEVIITDSLKQRLESSGLTGITFRPVIKHHIIELSWERWVLTALEPPMSLETSEPLDYFTNQPHVAQIADKVGELWELSLKEHALWVSGLGITSWDGIDWFRVKDSKQPTDYIFVSARAKTWLEQTVPAWVTFGDVRWKLRGERIIDSIRNGAV